MYKVNLTIDPPWVLPGGKMSEVRLKANVTRVEGSGPDQKILAAEGTVRILQNDEVINEAPANEDGIVTHKLELPLQTDSQSVRFDAIFRSPSGEIASTYQRITIPPTPQRDRKDRTDWQSVGHRLALTATRQEAGHKHHFILQATLVRTERRGDKETREVPVPGKEVIFLSAGKNLLPHGEKVTTDAAGEAFFTTGVFEEGDYDRTLLFSARVTPDRENMVSSKTLSEKVPAKKRVDGGKACKLTLHPVTRLALPSDVFRFNLQATLVQLASENRETPLRDVPVRFFINQRELEQYEAGIPPRTDAAGEAFEDVKYGALERGGLLRFVAKAEIEGRTVVSRTVTMEMPAKQAKVKKPVPTAKWITVQDCGLGDQGHHFRVLTLTAKDGPGVAGTFVVTGPNLAGVTLLDKPSAPPLTGNSVEITTGDGGVAIIVVKVKTESNVLFAIKNVAAAFTSQRVQAPKTEPISKAKLRVEKLGQSGDIYTFRITFGANAEMKVECASPISVRTQGETDEKYQTGHVVSFKTGPDGFATLEVKMANAGARGDIYFSSAGERSKPEYIISKPQPTQQPSQSGTGGANATVVE